MKLTVLILLIASSSHAFTVDDYCRAILKAEGKWTYGIKSVPVKSKVEAYRICRKTVIHAAQDFKGRGDFVTFLGSRYCPVGAKNDPTGLNINWTQNVRWFLYHQPKTK
jgi:hypothetical protein